MSNWNFDDFLRRLEAIKGMGSLEELLAQVPGLSSILRDVDFDFADLEPIEQILRAMTMEERLNPGLLEGEDGLWRRERIAENSETSVEAVDSLIWQFRSLCQMLEAMSPEEVTQELMKSMDPGLEDWQQSPDAWKGDGELPAIRISEPGHEDDEASHERPSDWLTREALNRRLDEILRKIGADGMDSLSPAEKAFLDVASQRLRATS